MPDATPSKTVTQLLLHADRIFELLDDVDLATLGCPDSIACDDPEVRRVWSLFSIWNLFVNAALAEQSILTSIIDGAFPPPIQAWSQEKPRYSAPHTAFRGFVLREAWRGTSLIDYAGNCRRNAIGALSFLFFFLFLFEGYCKIVLAAEITAKFNRDPSLGEIAKEVLAGSYDADRIESLRYLIGYRNTWHTFGRHHKTHPVEHSRFPHLSFREGDVIPVISEEDSLALLQDVFDLLLEIDEDKRPT